MTRGGGKPGGDGAILPPEPGERERLEAEIDSDLADLKQRRIAVGANLRRLQKLMQPITWNDFVAYVQQRFDVRPTTAQKMMAVAREIERGRLQAPEVEQLTWSQLAHVIRVDDLETRARVIRASVGRSERQTEELVTAHLKEQQPKPYADTGRIAFRGNAELIVGDAYETLRTLPSGSVSLCVTSPPHLQLRDYGIHGQIGQERTVGAYTERLVLTFQELDRLLTPSGSIYVFIGDKIGDGAGGPRSLPPHGDGRLHDSYAGWRVADPRRETTFRGDPAFAYQHRLVPERLATALQDAGLVVRARIVWVKPDPKPGRPCRRPAAAHEVGYLIVKDPRRSYYDGADIQIERTDGRGHKPAQDVWFADDTVWIQATAKGVDHLAAMPLALAERCIRVGSSEFGVCPACRSPYLPDGARRSWRPSCRCEAGPAVPSLVLDPFVGSGTVALAALRLGRSAIGIDLDPRAIETALARIERAARDWQKKTWDWQRGVPQRR